MFPLDDTIAAIATAPRNAERGIIRLSGKTVTECVAPWFACEENDWASTTRAHVHSGSIRLDDTRSMPCDLYLWPTSSSYTRQPSIELHTLGNRPLLERVLGNVCETGARLANPGEFTLRAFLSGRLDLAQAEAVLGIIDAEGDSQFDVALSQLAGGISSRLNDLRDLLLNLCADLEAGLDFVEEDIEFVSNSVIVSRLEESVTAIDQMREQMTHRTVGEQPAMVTLAGAPNVGKSSLLNALAGEDAAIVSPTAGTTRDYVSKVATLAGLRCELVDTAGIETQTTGPAAAAQAKTAEAIARAQIRILCLDTSRPLTNGELLAIKDGDNDLTIGTKSDLPDAGWDADKVCDVVTSSSTGQGINRLKKQIATLVAADPDYCGETVGPTAVRCRDSLRMCSESLRSALSLARNQSGDELIAAELRTTLDQLGQVVGAIYTDDILDRVFSRFCIGK